ncbi:inactive protein RESTRICTED TEV MOVEMENT 1-like isoform X2 [Carex rostrata]
MVTASEAFSWHLRGREIHIRLGPCGNTDGINWDDGCHQRIESIFVSYSSNHIHSIQTVYKDFSDNIFLAPQHGSYFNAFEAVHPPPETPITRIDGYFNKWGITCLQLSTNNGKMCSFGTKTGSPFIYKDPRGFTGFHGRADGNRLTALGVYINSSASIRS